MSVRRRAPNGSKGIAAGSGPGAGSPLLVQQAMIDKVSAKIQLMVVPQGQNFLMQLPASGGK